VLTVLLTGHLRLKNCKEKGMKRVYSFMITLLVIVISGTVTATAQTTFPAGINYQAVARNSSGDELVNTDIEVQFSIRKGSPTGEYVYQEVFTDVTTSRYGVFSLIIGKGDPVIGTFNEIDWSTANHYLQVAVKFENNFIEMGTMQFMAVPYALYAAKSLEPGPVGPPGPQGEPGDPASDDQELSYNRATRELSISGGNSLPLDSEVAFRAINTTEINLPNEEQVKLIFDDCTTAPNFNIGGYYSTSLGEFEPPTDGVYTFNVSLRLPTNATVLVKVDDREEILVNSFNSPGRYRGNITLRLASSNIVTVWVVQTNGYPIPLAAGGYFSGFRVY
jgi:hypothetical protein